MSIFNISMLNSDLERRFEAFMACDRTEVQRIADSYGVRVELIDFPIGSEGYMVIISGRQLADREAKELEYKLICACSDIKKVTVDITPDPA
jgi:hypothetical protein